MHAKDAVFSYSFKEFHLKDKNKLKLKVFILQILNDKPEN